MFIQRNRIVLLAFTSLLAVTACMTNDAAPSGGGGGGGKADGAGPAELDVTPAQRDTLVVKAATCPFMRSAVKAGTVRIRGSFEQPLGDTSDVIHLGNAGGGDLGKVLKFFADINHNRLNGPGGFTTEAVPENTFAIWFPGSRGAHPGHSGILMGDPGDVASGAFTPDRLARLTSEYSTLYSDGKRYISRDQIGAFIADNVAADPASRGFNLDGIKSLSSQVEELASRVVANDPNVLQDVLHLLVTSNDLVNSCGEFSLLFTRFADGSDQDGNPLISTTAVESLFRDGVFPAGWDQHPATAHEWMGNTLAILKSAIYASFGF